MRTMFEFHTLTVVWKHSKTNIVGFLNDTSADSMQTKVNVRWMSGIARNIGRTCQPHESNIIDFAVALFTSNVINSEHHSLKTPVVFLVLFVYIIVT